MKACFHCQAMVEDGVVFCPFCGVQIEAMNSVTEQSSSACHQDLSDMAKESIEQEKCEIKTNPHVIETPTAQETQEQLSTQSTSTFAPPPTAINPTAAPVGSTPISPYWKEPTPPPIEPHPQTQMLTIWSVVCLVAGFLGVEVSVAGLVALILSIIALCKVSKANRMTTVFERDQKIRTVKTLNMISSGFIAVCLFTFLLGLVAMLLGKGDIFDIFSMWKVNP